MAAKAGRLPSSGAISVSQINTQAGRSATATTSLGDNHMRAFQGGRATNSTTSLGDARGRAVTFGAWVKRSGVSSSVSIPTFSLSTYFHPNQTKGGFRIYKTVNVDVQPTWWASINNPRNMTATLGSSRSVTGGGTGGKKNYYSVTTYSGDSIKGRGYYSGKSTSNRNGQITLQYISLIKAGKGIGS